MDRILFLNLTVLKLSLLAIEGAVGVVGLHSEGGGSTVTRGGFEPFFMALLTVSMKVCAVIQ